MNLFFAWVPVVVLVLATPASTEKQCGVQAEILLVQDISDSYEDDLVNLAAQMPGIFEMLAEEFDGIKFGITTFIDAYSCGWKNDHCARVVQTLDSPDASNVDATRAVIESLRAGGGKDLPENLVGAVIRSVLSPQIGWSPAGTKAPDGKPIARIVIATTDFVPQLPGAKASCAATNSLATVFTPFQSEKGDWLEEDINAECETVEYPSLGQMIQVLEDENIYAIYLFGVVESIRSASYVNFVRHFGYSSNMSVRPEFWDSATGLAALMTAVFNEQFEYYPSVQNVDDQMDAVIDLIRPALRKIVGEVCESIATTTPTPAEGGVTSTPAPSGLSSTAGVPPPAGSVSTSAISTTTSTTKVLSVPTTAAPIAPATTSSTNLVAVETTTTTSATSSSTTRSLPAVASSSTAIAEGGLSTTTSKPIGGGVVSTTEAHVEVTATATRVGGGNGVTTTTTDEENAGSSAGIIIGSAAAGAAVLAGAVAAIGYFGFFKGPQPTSDIAVEADVETAVERPERETIEEVTASLFQ